MSRQFILAFATFFLITGVCVSSRAEGIDANGWVGALGGLHVPDAEDTSSRLAYGVTAGAKLGTEWGFGGYYLTSSKEEDVNGLKVDFDYSMIGAEVAYHFEGEAAGVYLGGRIGMTTLDVGTSDAKPMHLGLMAGYNHWLNDYFSIGGEAAFLNVASSDDMIGGAMADVREGFNILSFMASAKLWF